MFQLKLILHRSLILLFSVALSNIGMAQKSKNDSLINLAATTQSDSIKFSALQSLGWNYRHVNLDSAFMFNDAAYELIKDTPYDKRHVQVDYNYGLIHRYKGEYDKSLKFYRKNLKFYEGQKDSLEIAKTNYSIAVIYTEDQKQDTAIQYGITAIEYFQKVNFPVGLARTYNILGGNMADIEREKEGREYLFKGIKVARTLPDSLDAAHLYVNLGNNYMKVKEYDNALKYYGYGLRIDEAAGSSWGVSMVTQNIANIYEKQKKYPAAKKMLERSLALKKELGHTDDIIMVEGSLGYVHTMLGNPQKGLPMLEQSLKAAKEKELTSIIRENLVFLFQAYEEVENYKQANVYLSEYQQMNDSIRTAQLESEFADMETKYKTKEKEGEISVLNVKNELATTQLSHARNRNIFLSIVSLIFFGLLFLMYRMYKKIKKQNNEKDVLMREIHHRVKNNLQVISSLLAIQSRTIKDEKAKEAIQLGRTRVQSMSLIHQNLYQKDNIASIQMKDYLDKLVKGLVRTYSLNENEISLEIECEDLKLDVETVIPIGLIVNELISNALKYAFPSGKSGHIHILMKEQNNQLVLQVSDNGVGIDLNKHSEESFGHSLIRAFERKLNAKLSIDGTNGTTVKMLIKNYRKVA